MIYLNVFLFLFYLSKECVMLIDLDLQGHHESAILRNRYLGIL